MNLTPPVPPPHCPWCGCHVIRNGGGRLARHCSVEHATETRYRQVLAAVRKAPLAGRRPRWLMQRSPLIERAMRRLQAEARLPRVTGGET